MSPFAPPEQPEGVRHGSSRTCIVSLGCKGKKNHPKSSSPCWRIFAGEGRKCLSLFLWGVHERKKISCVPEGKGTSFLRERWWQTPFSLSGRSLLLNRKNFFGMKSLLGTFPISMGSLAAKVPHPLRVTTFRVKSSPGESLKDFLPPKVALQRPRGKKASFTL